MECKTATVSVPLAGLFAHSCFLFIHLAGHSVGVWLVLLDYMLARWLLVIVSLFWVECLVNLLVGCWLIGWLVD